MKVNHAGLKAVNGFGEMIIASRHGNFPVKKGDKLAETRIIPLVIREDKMENARQTAMEVTGEENTYFVIVTRGHRHDQTCLERIVRKKHAYIGMIGSRRRVSSVKEAVLEGGGDGEVLDKLYSPIGLDIGAEIPEETGVAITGEIIQVKNRKRRTCGLEADVMRRALHMIRSDGEELKLCHVDMTGADAEDEGMVCGGVVDVLLEVISFNGAS